LIRSFRGALPRISESAFVVDSADIIGDVAIGDFSSVWFNAVIRGDQNKIKIGKHCSIQDNVVVHCDSEHETFVGDNVTVGHGAILHGCVVKNNVLVGMNSTILSGAEVGDYSIIGAGALVLQDQVIPRKSLVLGIPGKVVREVTNEEMRMIERAAMIYVDLVKQYKDSAVIK